ncbi:MAG TPA: S8 family serine peptidase [Solirubrobacteraceae bacterium]|nr:S8 family serine peptidase [Solirubrobacteraceae bacterium]
MPAGAQAATELTGRLLVTTAPRAPAQAAAILDLDGVKLAGAQVPQIGLVSVRPAGHLGLAATARRLRELPGVRSVELEHRHQLRFLPDDPALTTPETAPGTAPGTPQEWWVARMNLPAAWDLERGDKAKVAIIDTGIDSGHPELSGKIDQAIDNDAKPGDGPATGDENGHGTHVSSLACAAGDNGIGIVGSGLNCRLLIFKTDLSDGSIARSIVQAADMGADAINMSFGTDGNAPAGKAISDAVDYAYAKNVVLVAAAADSPVQEQGDPANVLQPAGTGSDLTKGLGLSVTAANFADQRAPFAGLGSEISLAAYGAYDEQLGPAGLIGAFPGNPTELEAGGGLFSGDAGCACRTQIGGDSRYAYLQGTSMAAPIVSGIAALARALNPDATAADVIRVLKQTASRPAGSNWSPDLGWGIVDAGAALTAMTTIDRTPPRSKLRGPKTVRRPRAVKLTWSGSDPALPKLHASGIATYSVYRSTNRKPYKRIERTRGTSTTVQMRAGSRYRFYTIAVDKAGNREAVPHRPDLSVRVGR